MLALSIVLLAATLREDCVERFPHRAPASARRYFNTFDGVFSEVGTLRNVDPALLKAVAWCETRLDPCAVSPVGAQGLMQFMPATFGAVADAAGANDPFDPEHSIRSAGVYIAALLNHWQGSVEAVVASYNAGPNAVARALKRGRVVPAIEETQGYVTCVLGAYAQFRTLRPDDAHGANPITAFFQSLRSGFSWSQPVATNTAQPTNK